MSLVRGLVIGRVKALDDNHRGEVLVEFPLEVDESSQPAEDWARVVTMMAGADRGSWFMPEENDEVIVGFANDDAEDPYVLGYVWSEPPGSAAKPPDSAKFGQRRIKSLKGHTFTFDDTDDNLVELKTNAGHTVLLDEKNDKVEVHTGGTQQHKITLDASAITVEDKQQHTIKLDSSGIALTVGPRRIVMSSATIDFF
jgi:uncharacterized protein involved in type VI secretion and phage assembly